MSQHYFLIDLEEARAKMVTMIQRKKNQVIFVKELMVTLQGLEGTILTWRLAKKLEKAHPGVKFAVSDKMSWYELILSSPDFDEISLNMGYKGQVVGVNMEEFVKQNQRHLLDEQRIVRYTEELTTLEERVTRYNDALKEMRAAHEHLGEGRWCFTENNILSVKEANGRWYTDPK